MLFRWTCRASGVPLVPTKCIWTTHYYILIAGIWFLSIQSRGSMWQSLSRWGSLSLYMYIYIEYMSLLNRMHSINTWCSPLIHSVRWPGTHYVLCRTSVLYEFGHERLRWRPCLAHDLDCATAIRLFDDDAWLAVFWCVVCCVRESEWVNMRTCA